MTGHAGLQGAFKMLFPDIKLDAKSVIVCGKAYGENAAQELARRSF
jgi:hypothetical protein